MQRGSFHPIFEIELSRIALIQSTQQQQRSVHALKDSLTVLLEYPDDIGNVQFSLLNRTALLQRYAKEIDQPEDRQHDQSNTDPGASLRQRGLLTPGKGLGRHKILPGNRTGASGKKCKDAFV